MNRALSIKEKSEAYPGDLIQPTGLPHPPLKPAAKDTVMERNNKMAHLMGLPAGPGRAEGQAVVVKNGSLLPKLSGRTILVCEHPSRELALLFPRLSGLITERGGQTASAVIQARELGIPVILGVAMATESIHDGDYLRMDGDKGSLEVTR